MSVENRHKFRKGMHAVFVDLKMVFDSRYLEVPYDLLRLCGISARISGVLTGLYLRIDSVVRCMEVERYVKLLSCAHEIKAAVHSYPMIFVWTEC